MQGTLRRGSLPMVDSVRKDTKMRESCNRLSDWTWAPAAVTTLYPGEVRNKHSSEVNHSPQSGKPLRVGTGASRSTVTFVL